MSESMFSLAEERHDPALRAIGLAMEREESGFVEVGPALSGEDSFLGLCPNSFTRLVPGSSFPQERIAG